MAAAGRVLDPVLAGRLAVVRLRRLVGRERTSSFVRMDEFGALDRLGLDSSLV